MLKNVCSLSLILMVGESHWTFISLTSIYITLYLIVQIKFVIPFYSMSLGFVVKVIDFSSPREFIYMVFLNTKLLIFLGLLVIFWICLFQLKIYICSVFSWGFGKHLFSILKRTMYIKIIQKDGEWGEKGHGKGGGTESLLCHSLNL